jgi:hypothetical protein
MRHGVTGLAFEAAAGRPKMALMVGLPGPLLLVFLQPASPQLPLGATKVQLPVSKGIQGPKRFSLINRLFLWCNAPSRGPAKGAETHHRRGLLTTLCLRVNRAKQLLV